jgi:transcriptional regulator with XRE-family HTH domain
MKINERIRTYRLNRGLKLKYVSSNAGMAMQRLSALERGYIRLTADEFESICTKGLNVSPCIFFTNEFLNNEK